MPSTTETSADDDDEDELGVLLLRSRSTASEGLKKLHEVAAFTPDYDFKLKLVLKCHLTLIDYEDRTMGSAEA